MQFALFSEDKLNSLLTQWKTNLQTVFNEQANALVQSFSAKQDQVLAKYTEQTQAAFMQEIHRLHVRIEALTEKVQAMEHVQQEDQTHIHTDLAEMERTLKDEVQRLRLPAEFSQMLRGEFVERMERLERSLQQERQLIQDSLQTFEQILSRLSPSLFPDADQPIHGLIEHHIQHALATHILIGREQIPAKTTGNLLD
ncbi:MAG TPA: hypothetical protein VKR06_14815 [Ktedonosporobacter sp.]|nr:hypothetical protein [Ktedonosporobacter sp.]